MSIFRIVLVLDDSVAAQLTLLGQIQATLSSIAGNAVPASFNGSKDNIEVQKIA